MANKFLKSMAEPNSPMEVGIKVGTGVVSAILATAAGWGAGKFFAWVDERKAKKQREKEEAKINSIPDVEILKRAQKIMEEQEKEKSGKTGDLTAQ